MPSSKISLSDIAKIAGVSTSTVSRALADSPQVSEAVKVRIRTIAAQHNYQAHLGARNFRLQKSNVIGLVIPIEANDTEILSNPFVLEFIGAVGLELRRHGYNLLLLHDRYINEQLWSSGLVDGYVQLGNGIRSEELNALPADLPLVIWGAPSDNQTYSSVCVDNFELAREAVNHLISQGRRLIGFITGGIDDNFTEGYNRYLGYRQALEDAGLPFHPMLMTKSIFNSVSGVEATRKLLEQAPDIDAIFAAHSDMVALVAIDVLRQAGRRVPEDVAVMGFDNINLGVYLGTPLSTVSQELHDAGARTLIETLMKRIAGEPPEAVTVKGRLVLRQST